VFFETLEEFLSIRFFCGLPQPFSGNSRLSNAFENVDIINILP
jgi:hypothetical protein